MGYCTAVERQIMGAIWRSNGELKNLSGLALELETERAYVLRCAYRLQKRGCLEIIKEKPPKPVKLCAVNGIPMACGYECRLKSNLAHGGLMDYPKPSLTMEEQADAGIIARKINSHPQINKRLTMVFALVVSNVQLVKEVNEHRAARGFELLKVIDMKDMKVG